MSKESISIQMGDSGIIWRRNFMRLANEYRKLFNRDDSSYQEFFKMVSSNFGIVGCFVSMYSIYASEGRIERIEMLEKKQKRELWEEAKLFLGDRATQDRCVMLVKAFHFFGTFIQEEPEESFAN